MKSFLYFFIFLLPLSIFADDNDYPGDGSSAILFEFNQISLSNFKGGVGGKFFHSDTRAFRIGLTGSFRHLQTDREQGQDITENSYSAGLRAGEFFHRNLRHYIRGYTGLELTVDYSRYKFEREENGAFPHEEKRRILRGSIGPVFGIEYFLTKNLSVAGEYALRLTALRTIEDRTIDTETRTDTTTQYLVGIQTGGIFLSIYF